MPPYSNVRKSSLMSVTPSNADLTSQQRRTTSGRAIRANTTRPTNYYARPFANLAQEEAEEVVPTIGFFPAVTFFADAIDALPKETVRQFTLMKEVEAKVHGPAEQLGAMCDELMQAPVPRRKGGQLAAAAMMTFTAPNSNAGSTNPSIINGVAPNMSRYGQDSAAVSTVGEEIPQETEEGLARRRKFAELRQLAVNLIPNMDEKNAVLAEAIRVMNAQLSRIDGVMPYVDAEIPEEARLGSMTHWAYAENRKQTKAAAQASRRDIGATNTLAAAATAMHDADIAQTRRDGGRDTGREKVGRARNRDQVDSEFEERPRKTNAKLNKARLATAPTGLGISNGEPVKRRKIEKLTHAAPSMERQVSNAGRAAAKAQRDTSKSVPAEESARKGKSLKTQITQPKRRGIGSAHASPALASSPLSTHVPLAGIEQVANKQQSARNRQNSTASNLRHERLADESTSRPSSAAGKSNGVERSSTRIKRPREDVEVDVLEGTEKVPESERSTKGGDEDRGRPAASRSNSSNKTPSGRASKAGTPRTDSFPNESASMSRTRSTRATKVNDSGSDAPVKGHKRNGGGVGSVSGLMKQIAPFNRSPDLDRHRKSDSDNSSVSDPADDSGKTADGISNRPKSEQRSSRPTSRPASSMRRNASEPKTMPNDLAADEQDREDDGERSIREVDEQDEQMADTPEAVPALIPDVEDEIEEDEDEEPDAPLSPSLTPQPARYEEPGMEQADTYDDNDATLEDVGAEAEDEDEDGDEPDPDDPNEPKYCYCQRGSYGDMVGCDNPQCPREWFHLGCTDLTEMPSEEESWFCNYCRPKNGTTNGRRGTTRGKGRSN